MSYKKRICPEGDATCQGGWMGGDLELGEQNETWWRDKRRRRKRDTPTFASHAHPRHKRSTVEYLEPLAVPLYSMGAGDKMGVTVMLFADTPQYFMTSAFFEGWKVLVHHPEDFPAVKEKGFAVSPGTETFVAVDAFDVISTDDIRDIDVEKRHCYFDDEIQLDYFNKYTRSSCMVECQVSAIINGNTR